MLMLAWSLTRIGLTALLAVDVEAAGLGDIVRYFAVADDLVNGSDVTDYEYPFGSLAVIVPPVLLGASDGLDYVAAFVALAIGFDLVALISVLLSSPRGTVNLAGAWIWVVAPFLLGVLSITRLDIVTCGLAALGLSLALRYRRTSSAGFLLAAGAAIKVWPGLLLLPLLARRRNLPRLAVGVGAAAGVLITAAQLLQGWPLVTSFLAHQRNRGLQIESFPALPLLWIDKLGLVDYRISYQFGSREIQGPGSGFLASASGVAMIGALLAVWQLSRLNADRFVTPEERVAWTGTLAVAALIVTNKVFSAQYILWLIVMTAILSGWTRKPDTRAVSALVAAAVATHVVWPLMWDQLHAGSLLPLLVLTLRDALVLYLVWRLARAGLHPKPSDRPGCMDDHRGAQFCAG